MRKIFLCTSIALCLFAGAGAGICGAAEIEPEIGAQSKEERHSIYDLVKPSSVKVPEKIHLSEKKSSFDMSMEIGDVIFNPIPNTRR